MAKKEASKSTKHHLEKASEQAYMSKEERAKVVKANKAKLKKEEK